MIYKITVKPISLRIDPFFTQAIFVDQFGFLKGTCIQEVIRYAKEVILSVKNQSKNYCYHKIGVVKIL